MSWHRLQLSLAAAFCLAACHHAPSTPVVPPEPTTLGTVERQCGSCHMPSHPDAMAEALAWFDLEDPEWLEELPRETFDRAFMPRILPWIEMATADEVHAAIAADLVRRSEAP